MAELVDALVSGASVERRAGSSPVLGTKVIFHLFSKELSVSCLVYRYLSLNIHKATSAGGEIGIHATLRG